MGILRGSDADHGWTLTSRGEQARYLEREYIKYCLENNLDKVKACLTLEVDVNVNSVSEDADPFAESGDRLCSGLIIAAERNYLDLLDILLSHPNIDVNQIRKNSGHQMTALMFACGAGHSDVVSKLVQQDGVDVNYQAESGYTAANSAAFNGHKECVRILARSGKVDWNKRDKKGAVPLYWALDQDHSDIVDIIVKQPGMDYSVKTEAGLTLAHVAVMKSIKSVEILAAQEKFKCWNVPDKKGDTAVMKALKMNKGFVVDMLIRCPRVDLKCRDLLGWSLLARSISMNNEVLVKSILSRMKRTYTGTSLARIAVEVLEEQDIKLLVQSNTVDWNETEENEDPAILWARPPPWYAGKERTGGAKRNLRQPELQTQWDLRLVV